MYVDAFALQEVNVVLCLYFLTCLFICLQIGSAEASVYVDAFALQEVNVVLCLYFLTCLFICLQIGSAEASVYVDAFALQEVNVVLCLCFLTHVCFFVSRLGQQKPACMWMPLPCRK